MNDEYESRRQDVCNKTYNQDPPLMAFTWSIEDQLTELGHRFSDGIPLLSGIKALLQEVAPFRPGELVAVFDLLSDAARAYESTVFWQQVEAEENGDKRRALVLRLGIRCHWVCPYCGESGTAEHGPDLRSWHVDHLYPRARGGDDAPDNLVLACATCNIRKSSRLLIDFIRRRESSGNTGPA